MKDTNKGGKDLVSGHKRAVRYEPEGAEKDLIH